MDPKTEAVTIDLCAMCICAPDCHLDGQKRRCLDARQINGATHLCDGSRQLFHPTGEEPEDQRDSLREPWYEMEYDEDQGLQIEQVQLRA